MISLLARHTLLPAARAVGWVLIEVAVPLLVLVFVLGFRLVGAVRGPRPAERRPAARRLTSSVSVRSGRPLASRA
jgi:hypothetical protein